MTTALTCEGQMSPEGGLGKCNKMRDVGFLGEPAKLLKPGRMHKVVQGHHRLQIMPAVEKNYSVRHGDKHRPPVISVHCTSRQL